MGSVFKLRINLNKRTKKTSKTMLFGTLNNKTEAKKYQNKNCHTTCR